MALQTSVAVRNGKLDSIETVIGASPTLEIRSGAPPANCAAADTGTLLATLQLPADWMSNAALGVKEKLGTWQVEASTTGTAGHFRVKQSAICHMQGTVGLSAADLILDNVSINAGQTITITQFTWTAGNV